MDIEDPKTNSSTLLSSDINPSLSSSKSTILSKNTACLPITLSQRDFVNADFLVQSLFLYVLRKSGGEQKGDLQEGCYYMCKYLSPQYSIGCNGSLTVRVRYLDPANGDCDQIICNRTVEEPDIEGTSTQQQQMGLLKGKENNPSNLSENAVLFDWIDKILSFYSGMFSESETIDILQTIRATKVYIENIHSRISQLKLYHELHEERLQKISENRLSLMRQASKQYIQAHFEESDFILISHFQADLSAERVRFTEVEANPAALSLLGTHSSQFTNFIMRNGLQMCHSETHITDLLYQSLKNLIFKQDLEVNEFIVPDQRLVLIDRIIMTCDIMAVILQNTWDRKAPFIPKQLETNKNGQQKYSLESVLIQKIIISPEQIKEILDIRAAQQTLQSISDKENQFAYTVESENFCERFYPEKKLENNKNQNSKDKRIDQQIKEEQMDRWKICKIKDI